MRRHFPLAMLASVLAGTLSGCTHMGTNIAGQFSCRAQGGRSHGPACQPLSEVDARAIHQLVRDEASPAAERSRPAALSGSDRSRTGERTLRVVFPAHVDALGTLHEEAVVWTVAEPSRWTGELRGGGERKSSLRTLREALRRKDRAIDTQATASAGPSAAADPNHQPRPPESTAPPELATPFDSSPLALPSPGGEASADATASPPVQSAAEGSDMSPTPHVRTPRSLDEPIGWPSAEAIEAAKAHNHTGKPESASPSKEPK